MKKFFSEYELYIYSGGTLLLSVTIFFSTPLVNWNDLIYFGFVYLLIAVWSFLGRMTISDIEFRRRKVEIQGKNERTRSQITVYSQEPVRRFFNFLIGIFLQFAICIGITLPEVLIVHLFVLQVLFSRWYQRKIGKRFHRVEDYALEISMIQVAVYSIFGLLFPLSRWFYERYLY